MAFSRLVLRAKYLAVTVSIILICGTLAIIPVLNHTLGVYATVLAIIASLALQKYLASFIGHFVIRSSSIFDVGDRIRIDSVKGDVKHIGLFHVIVDEVGEDEKMGGELTGRIVHIPNLVVLDHPVLNYSKDYSVDDVLIACDYMFDEIRIPLKPKSDIKKAVEVLESLLKAENASFVKEAEKAFGDGQPNFINDLQHGHRVTIHFDKERVWIKGRYVTPVRSRNELKTKISMGFIERVRGDSTIEIN